MLSSLDDDAIRCCKRTPSDTWHVVYLFYDTYWYLMTFQDWIGLSCTGFKTFRQDGAQHRKVVDIGDSIHQLTWTFDVRFLSLLFSPCSPFLAVVCAGPLWIYPLLSSSCGVPMAVVRMYCGGFRLEQFRSVGAVYSSCSSGCKFWSWGLETSFL